MSLVAAVVVLSARHAQGTTDYFGWSVVVLSARRAQGTTDYFGWPVVVLSARRAQGTTDSIGWSAIPERQRSNTCRNHHPKNGTGTNVAPRLAPVAIAATAATATGAGYIPGRNYCLSRWTPRGRSAAAKRADSWADAGRRRCARFHGQPPAAAHGATTLAIGGALL